MNETQAALDAATDAGIKFVEREVKIALLLLCETARLMDARANYVHLDDSDQGDFAYYECATETLDGEPLEDAESADEDWGATSHLYDRHWNAVEPYLVAHRYPYQWNGCAVDIAKVLADRDEILAAPEPLEVTVLVVDDGSGPMAVDPFSTRADALASLRLNHTDGDTDAPDDDEDLPRYLTDQCGYIIHLETVPLAAWPRSAR